MKTPALVLAAATLLLAPAARAQAPVSVSSDFFAFPGSFVTPGSAASAGLALADRWLADEAFFNPAASAPYTLALSPLILHVSRQDLRADHRSYDETSAFFDGAGGYFSLETGRFGFTLYGHQPVLRIEENSFLTGSMIGPSGSIATTSDARELRGGLAVKYGPENLHLGVAGEWTHRVDHYERVEQTGAPAPNTYVTDFSGDAVGGQAGFRATLGEGAGGIIVGGALRYVAALDLTGDETLSGASGTTVYKLSTTREAGWEGGVSVSYRFTDAFRGLVAGGGRSAQAYEGWGLGTGAGGEWKVAGEYHDRRDTWTVRFGYGMEEQTGVPEPRASVVGLGLGFVFETTTVDLGVVHRSFTRGDHPSSSEDKVVFSLVQRF